MNKMKYLLVETLCFLVCCSLVVEANASDKPLVRQKRHTCCPRVTIRNCNINGTTTRKWSVINDMKIVADVSKDCTDSSLDYNWKLSAISGSILKMPSDTNNAVLYIFKYSLKPGTYSASLKVTETYDSSCTSQTETCNIDIIAESPDVVIHGGHLRTAPGGVTITSRAMIQDISWEKLDTSGYVYKWTCAISTGQTCKITPYSDPDAAYISKKYVISNTKLTIMLNITSIYGRTGSATQNIHVGDSTTLSMKIYCIKSCLAEFSNSDDVAVFYGSCGHSCAEKANITWNVVDVQNNEGIDFSVNTVVYMSTNYGSVKPNTLYKAIFHIGNNNYAEFHFKTDDINQEECNVQPNERSKLFTLFKIDCRNYKDGHLYFLYQMYKINGKDHPVLLATETIAYFEAYLGSGDIYIQVYRKSGFYKNFKINTIPITNNKVDVWSYVKTIPSLIQRNLQEEAVQMVNCLIDIIGDDKLEIKKLGFHLIKHFKQFPMHALMDSFQIGTLIGKLTLPNDDADPVYQSYLSSLCLFVAEKFFEHITRETHRLTQFAFAKQFQEYMDACVVYAFNDKFKEDKSNNEQTTKSLLSDDYVDYDDLENAYRKEEFVYATDNGIEITRIIAAAVAQTLNVDQVNYDYENDIYYSLSALQPYINKQYLSHDKATIILGYVPKYHGTKIACAHVVYKKNLFWWHQRSEDIGTAVTDVNLYHSPTGRMIMETGGNLTIIFQVEQAKSLKEIEGSVTVPSNLEQWTPKVIDYKMTVHRLNIEYGTNLILKFEVSEDVEVVVIINRRPCLEDFESSFKIGPSSKIKIFFNNVGNGWFYIAILPSRNKLKESSGGEKSLNYKIKYIIQACNYWDTSSKTWSTSGCKTPKPTSEKIISCECDHMSAFMSTISPTITKEDPILIIPFLLELRYTYIVPTTAFICLVLYLIFVIIAIMKTKLFDTLDKVLFLADNAKNERYGYLLIVATGNKKNAGTSSNISLKIIGKKATSQPHVLNYPDPEKRLLQQNSEDWFILTTKKHLGDLIEIDLWFDCVGIRSSWYCRFIRVFDLQTNEEWVFNVNLELTVMKENQTYYKIKSEVATEEGQWRDKLKKKARNYQMLVHSWNLFSNTEDFLSYLRRLTIILSMNYTVFTITLFIIASPSLMLKDSMDYGHYKMHPIIFVAAFASSLLSFLLHLGLQILFQIALISLIIINMTLLIVFGFWVPYIAAFFWLTSIPIAILLIVIVYEAILMFIQAFFLKPPEKKVISTDVHVLISEVELQRKYLYRKFGDLILRPYLTFKYEPLTADKIKEKALTEKARYEIKFLVKELITFSLYVFLLIVIIISRSSIMLRQSNEQMKQLILPTDSRSKSELFHINKYNDVYDYVNETLIPSCYPTIWYEGANITETGLLIDVTNKLLGVIEIRQKRVVRNVCKIPKPFNFPNFTCVPEYDEEYSGNYPDMPYAGMFKYIWRKRKPKSVDAFLVTYGNINWYSASGFLVRLGRTRHNSIYTLKYLKENNWIDERTRVVFIKFWTYNVNENLFNTVHIIFEKSATGLFINSYLIHTTMLFAHTTGESILNAIIATIFVIVNLKLISILIEKFLKSGLKAFLNFWNIYTIIIIFLTIILVTLFIERWYVIIRLMNDIDASPNNAFVNFSTVTFLSQIIKIVAALLVCLAIINLWKFLRFAAMFRVMENTLLEARRALLIIFIYHIVILLAFMFSGYVLFGSKYDSFKDLTQTFTTLTLLSLNLFFFDVNRVFKDHLSKLYFAFYTLFMLSIYTLYIAIIVLHYSKCSRELSNLKESYTIKDYLKDEFTYYKELLRVRLKARLRAGQEYIDEAIYPKAIEHRYADCLTISSHNLDFMTLIARGVIRNLRSNDEKILTQQEINMMFEVIQHLIDDKTKTGNKEYFYKARHGDDIDLIYEDRIEQMERVAKRLFLKTKRTLPRHAIIEGDNNLDRLQYYVNVLQLISETLESIIFVD